MSVDFTTLKSHIRAILDAPTGRLADAQLGLFINAAQREICEAFDFSFLETATAVTITAGTRTTALPTAPTAIARTLLMQYQNPDDAAAWTNLKQVPHDDLLMTYGYATAQSSGDPIVYSIWGETGGGYGDFFWGPTPSRNITAFLYYYQYLDDLVNVGDHNDLTDSHTMLLIYKACAMASATLLEPEQVQLYEQAYQNERKRKASQSVRRRWNGSPPLQFTELR